MSGKGRIVALMILCIFLFAGIANAWVIKIIQPNGSESLESGKVYVVKTKINKDQIPNNVYLGRYKLYLSCDGGSWNLIANRACGIFSCPTDYPWEVPIVSATKICDIKAVLFDKSGNKLGSDKSDDTFTIEPFEAIPVTFP